MMLNQNEKEFVLQLVRKSLAYYFQYSDFLPLDENEISKDFGDNSQLLSPGGCFVTLHTRENQLRGCIGIIESDEKLYLNLIRYAVWAAVRDPRFPSVTVDELESLHLEVSVLNPPERLHNIDKIEVGTHGLIVEKGHYKGLLLPQVPVEWSWDKETFLKQTCHKAGLPQDAYLDEETKIYTFSAQVFGEEKTKLP